MSRTIFISAGEASGDLYGARLARELKARSPGLRLEAFGGPRLAAAGATVDPALSAGAVMGWTGAIRHLARFAAVLRTTRARWTRRPPAAVVLIDYPGFNLRLARVAHDLGIPAYYFICPQVWVWGANRLLVMRRVLRRTFPILPFEEQLHQAYGIRAVFLGHPLLDHMPSRIPPRGPALKAAGLDPRRPVALLLPGSRPDEIRRIFPLLLDAATTVARRQPALQWVAVAAPGARPRLKAALDTFVNPGVRIVEDAGYGIRAHARFAWVTSGTATLELGLLGIPQIMVYRGSWLNVKIARLVITVPYVGLVNLIVHRGAMTELLQEAATPDALVQSAARLSTPRVAAVARALARELRTRLGAPGATGRVAAALLADLKAVAR